MSPYLYNRVWSELTCRNSLSYSRLACSRLSAHIQLSVNNPDTNGAAKLLNTTRQYNYNGHLVRPLSTVEWTRYARVFHCRQLSNYNVFHHDCTVAIRRTTHTVINSVSLQRTTQVDTTSCTMPLRQQHPPANDADASSPPQTRTSCCSTDSERSYRCFHLANDVNYAEYVDRLLFPSE